MAAPRGKLRTDERPTRSCTAEARGEEFLRHGGQVLRRNRIWRRVIDVD